MAGERPAFIFRRRIMSSSAEIKYTCPYCGREMTITVYQTVNADTDPDLRESCMSGDIFRHSCPHCHTDFMIMNHLVYSDPSHKFVLYVSQDPVSGIRGYAEPLLAAGYKLRRCESIQAFTEKIQIFEDGMDDVVVELAKYDSFIEFIDNRKGNPEDITSIEYQRVFDGVMKVNIRTDDKGLTFHIPVNLLEEEVKENQERFTLDGEDFPCVNSDWIISLFTEPAGTDLKS